MMSCGPVTACAEETPVTCRILPVTSLALPGDVSIRMKAFTTIVPSFDARSGRTPAGAIVGIKSTPALASKITRIDVLAQQRAGPVLVLAQARVQHLQDVEAGVESNQVGKLQRTQR